MCATFRLDAQVALVTGGGRGIGKAIALALAAEGVSVAVASRTLSELQEVAALAEQLGAKALPIQADVTKADEVDRMIARTESSLGPLDLLVNNAGRLPLATILETSEEDWDKTTAVNLKAAFLCSKAALARMAERRRGRIIIISSLAGKKPYPGQSAYCASKHGLEGFAKVLAIEAKEYNVRVQVVSPGGVNTKLTRDARKDVDVSEWMRPDEVARAVIYLCSQGGTAVSDEIVLRRWESAPWTH